MTDQFPKLHEILGFPLDDVESEFIDYHLIDSLTTELDLEHESDFVKLAWALMAIRIPIVRYDDE